MILARLGTVTYTAALLTMPMMAKARDPEREVCV
jgi:hypothetical protein